MLGEETKKRRNEMSRAHVSNYVPTSLPNGYEYLPYQVAGLEWMLSHPYDVMWICDDMGLGKSLQAIGFANEKRIKRIQIIAPSVAVCNWLNEIEKFHKHRSISVQVIRKEKDTWDKDVDVTISSYDLYNPDKAHNKTILIVDEFHYLKNLSSNRTKNILNAKNLAKYKYKLLLSGTPMPNRPVELYSLFKHTCHHVIGYMNKELYGYKFCNAYRDKFGRLDYSGASNLEELNLLLRENIMLRRMKEDVLKQLPDKRINIIQFEMDSTVEELDAKIRPFLPEIVKGVQHGAGLDGIATHRRLISEKKIPLCVQYIKMVLESEKQIVLFAYHREVIARVEEELKTYGVVKVIGGMSADQKEKAAESFRQGNFRIFLGQIQSAGIAINLVNASKVIMIEPDWVAGNNKQAIDRCYRIGQKNFVDVDFLVYRRSVDEYILKANFKKQSVADATLA